MKQFILSAGGSLPTCVNLRDAIEEIRGLHFPISTHKSNVNVLFRYGNIVPVTGTDTNFNSIQFIELARDKAKFSEFCQQNNIYSPIFHQIVEIPERFPILVRHTLTGFKGRGIVVVHNRDEFEREMRSDYRWTPFVNCAFELRVHLFGTRIARLFKKVREGDETNPTPIRNAESGYHFADRHEEMEKYAKLIPLMEQLGGLLIPMGGNFSAVDVGWDRDTHNYFIFEINSAPGLNSNTVQEYARYFIENL